MTVQDVINILLTVPNKESEFKIKQDYNEDSPDDWLYWTDLDSFKEALKIYSFNSLKNLNDTSDQVVVLDIS